jgi:hypothetical protein
MKFIKGIAIFLLAFVVALALVLGIGWYLVSSPKVDLDVSWTEEDFNSYLEKGGIIFDESHASMEDIFAGNFTTEGVVRVDALITNSELTAVANMSTNENSIMKDVQIKCVGEDTLEMSGVTGNLTNLITVFPELEEFRNYFALGENKPIYMKSTLYYDKETQRFEGTTMEMYVGKIKMPIDEANNNLRKGGNVINDIVKSLEGFTVNEFKVTEEGFNFDGTIPKAIRSAGSFSN